MDKNKVKCRKLAAQAVFALGLLFLILTLLRFAPAILFVGTKMPPSVIFRQYVLEQTPESVTNLRADQPTNILGYQYTFRFNINRSDLALLIDSGPLKRVWNVKYRNGRLDWAWDTWHGRSMNGCSMIVSNSGFWRREPLWFEPQKWQNPEAYALDETVGGRMKTKVLLYNEKEGEAYFIVSNLK